MSGLIRELSSAKWQAFAGKAFRGLSNYAEGRWTWDITGEGATKCDNPIRLLICDLGRLPEATSYKHKCQRVLDRRYDRTIEMDCRCRSCGPCLLNRAREWAARSYVELSRASRAWFVTLTLNPGTRFRLTAQCALRASQQGPCFHGDKGDRGNDFDKFSPRKKSEWLSEELKPEVTRYIKRIRKESSALLRYICVTETHKDGTPHVHLLVYETPGNGSVSYRTLSRQWRRWGLGICEPELVACERDSAWYVCSYISKGINGRVRASFSYGKE